MPKQPRKVSAQPVPGPCGPRHDDLYCLTGILLRNHDEVKRGNEQALVKRATRLTEVAKKHQGMATGTEFAIEEVTEGVLLRPVKTFRPARFEEVFGCLKHRGRAKNLRQTEKAIAKGVRARHDRGRY